MLTRIKRLFGGAAGTEVSAASDSGYQPLNPEIYRAYNQFRPAGPRKLFCYVPFSNMSFSFEGRVLACAYNQKVVLGRYPQQSIRQMWFDSEEGKRLREHMLHNDLSYGCKHCKYFFENRKFSGLKPLVFDVYSDIQDYTYPRVLEFELSNTCNLECVMCNGKVSSSIRKNRDKLPPIKSPYDDAFVEQLDEFIPHLKEAKFYGGEPLLIPIYYKIWDRMLSLNPGIKIFVITNGTTLDDRIKAMLERGNFDLAVSMDSPDKEPLESIRVHTRHEVVMQNIEYFNDYCRRRKKNLVISFTLMRINWREFPKIIRFCNDLDAILYVSYLKTPPQFGLWNLPSEELAAIQDELKNESFPVHTFAQQNNKRCFDDFLVYLENARITNLTRPRDEIIPMQRFPERQSGAEEPASCRNVQKESEPEAEPTVTSVKLPSFEPEIDYEALVRSALENFMKGKPGDEENCEAFFSRIRGILELHFPDADRNKLYFHISCTPIDVVYADVMRFSDEELRNAIHKVVGR
ncbi:MAG: hypothetical protein KatS3mg031_0863 [Chitinophagales bacterium]|nr:MAG: hypothetical protein KatS3mg031_0863 [Chitinophagales bacterium]